MNRALNKVIKSHIVLSVLSVFAIALLMTGVSYALFVNEYTNTDNQKIVGGNLDIDLSSTSGSIVLSDLYPTKFTEISADENKYSFKISNTGDYKITYLIYLTDNTSTFLNENTEYSNYIKMDKSKFKNIDFRVDSSYVINNLEQVYNESNGRMHVLEGILEPGASEDHYIQFWLDNGDTTPTGASNDVIENLLALNINMEAVEDEDGTVAINKIYDESLGGYFERENLSGNSDINEMWIECSSSEATWGTYPRGLTINSINSSKTLCDFYITGLLGGYLLKDWLINFKLNIEEGEGMLVHETFTDSDGNLIDAGYRYEGKDPNNYIWFNNELWRIIGIFKKTWIDEYGTHKRDLIKIIRNDPIGAYTYSSDSTSAWIDNSGTKGGLNSLLNDYYYNSLNGTNGIAENNNCYGSDNIEKDCDWTESGIRYEYKEFITNVDWELGGIDILNSSATNYYGLPSSSYYTAERSSNVYSSNSATFEGYIGLMYPSDYGFAAPASSCDRTTNLSEYGKNECAGNNWLYKNGNEWTMSESLNNKKDKIYINNRGEIDYTVNTTGYAVRPTLYLKSLNYTSGDGSKNSPYIVEFD